MSLASSSSTLTGLPVAEDVRVWVSDLYLGAFLLCQGSRLYALRFDEGSRASLCFTGKDALHHRRAFAAGLVCVSLPAFREALNTLRDLVHDLQKSHPPKNQILPAPPRFRRYRAAASSL